MRKDISLFKLTIASLFVSSFSVLLSLFGDYSGNFINVAMALATGILFWLGLIVGYVSLIVINKHRKSAKKRRKQVYSSPGIITFFSSPVAITADILMIISFVLTLILMFTPGADQRLVIIALAFLLFSVHMHCVLNGANFKYIKSINKKNTRIHKEENENEE